MSTLEMVPSMVLPLAILSSARATSARQRTAATENASTFLMKHPPLRFTGGARNCAAPESDTAENANAADYKCRRRIRARWRMPLVDRGEADSGRADLTRKISKASRHLGSSSASHSYRTTRDSI